MKKQLLNISAFIFCLATFNGLSQSWVKILNTPDTASYSENHFSAFNHGDSVFIATQKRTGLGSGYFNYWSDDGFATIHTYNSTQLPTRPLSFYSLKKSNKMLGADFNGIMRDYAGGGNWNIFSNATSAQTLRVHEIATNSIILCAVQNPVLYRTAPVTANFTITPSSFSGKPIQSSILLTTPNRLIMGHGAVGLAGISIIDNGNVNGAYDATMTPTISSSSQFIRKIVKDNTGNLFAHVYGAKIYKSTDNGLNWTALATTFSPSGGTSYYKDIEIMSDGSLLIIGDGNKIFRSTNGGANASQFETGIPTTGFPFYDEFIKLRNGSIVCNVQFLNSTTFAVDPITSGLYKISVATALKENSQTLINYFIYPNPSNGTITISSKAESKLMLYNVLGQQLNTIELNSQNDYSVQITGLKTGIYFINDASGLNSKKIIVN